MAIWEIIVGVGTVASLAGLLQSMRDTGNAKQRAFLALAILFAGMSGYLFSINRELQAIEWDAAQISRSWPNNLPYDFDKTGVYRGIILQGFVFLEKHREQFPDNYALAKQMVENSRLTETVNRSGEFPPIADEVSRLHNTAEAIMTLVNGIAKNPSGWVRAR